MGIIDASFLHLKCLFAFKMPTFWHFKHQYQKYTTLSVYIFFVNHKLKSCSLNRTSLIRCSACKDQRRRL